METIIFVEKTIDKYTKIINSLKIPIGDILQPNTNKSISRIGFIWKIIFPYGNTPIPLDNTNANTNNPTNKYFTQEFVKYLQSFNYPVTVDLFYSPENVFEFVSVLNHISMLLPLVTFNYLPKYNMKTGAIIMESSGEQVNQFYFTDKMDLNWLSPFNSASIYGNSRVVFATVYNQMVTIYGEDFYEDIIVKVNGKVSPLVTIKSPIELEFQVPPTGLRGFALVEISNGTGFDTNNLKLSLFEPPKITSLNVNYGPVNGGQSLIIYGTNFYFHDKFFLKFNEVLTTSYEIVNSNEIRCFTPPSNTIGLVNMQINSAAGLIESSDLYSYVGTPEITLITHNITGNSFCPVTSTDRTVTIDGKEFYGFAIRGELPVITFNGIVIDDVQIISPTQITAKIPVKRRNPSLGPGQVYIYISTVGGTWTNYSVDSSGNKTINANLFSYYDVPVISSVVNLANGTNTCELNKQVSFKITGTSLFKFDAQPFKLEINGVAASTLTSISNTEVTGTVAIPGQLEWAKISFENIGGVFVNYTANIINSQLLYVDNPITVSQITGRATGINKIVINQIETVIITGTNFKQFENQSIQLKINGFVCNNIKLINATTITGVLNKGITTTGSASIWLKTSNGIYQNYDSSGAIISNLIYFTNQLAINSINPMVSPINNANIDITITGTDLDGLTEVLFDLSTGTIKSNTSTQAVVTVPVSTVEKTISIKVTGLLGSDTTTGFTYFGSPVITSLNVSECQVNTSTLVTITGRNFYNINTVSFGLNQMTIDIMKSTPTQIIGTVTIEQIGIFDVSVNGQYGSITWNGNFRCWSTPTITNVSPNKISFVGGTITVTGTDLDNPKIMVGTVQILSGDIISNSSNSIRFNVPAYIAGVLAQDITITGKFGEITSLGALSYISGPKVTNSNIKFGQNSSSTKIILTGTDLNNINQIQFGSTNLSANDYTIVDATTIHLQTPINAQLVGRVDIILVSSFGACAVPGGFTYTNGQYLYLRQNISDNKVESSSDGKTWAQINWGTTGYKIVSKCTVLLTTDLIVTGNNGFFIIGTSGITFDGAGHTVTINGAQAYPGLISNGTITGSGKPNTIIKNIGVLVGTNTKLKMSAGWIGQSYFARGVSDNVIDSCYSTGFVSYGAGGICGANAGAAMISSTLVIKSCYSTGSIDVSAGGICGFNAGYQMTGASSISIKSCYSTGSIDTNAGGICGSSAGYQMSGASSIHITSCYSTGSIDNNAGGICGYTAGDGMSGALITINSCYSTGSIGQYAGGICGYGAGNSLNSASSIHITSCYSTGSIGNQAGGICGYYAGYNVSTDSKLEITNCYTNKQIYGGNKNTIASKQTNCYVIGTAGWSDTDATASGALVEFPTDTLGVGSTWTRVGTNSPWVLSVFSSDTHIPNYYTNLSQSTIVYTTGPGKYSNSNGWTYQLLTDDTGILIDSTTGAITYDGVSQNITPVIAYKSGYSTYSIGNFKFNPTMSIDSIDIKQANVTGQIKATIIGTNLESISEIKFGSITVNPSSISANTSISVDVIIPSGYVGKVDITVTNNYGTSTVPGGFTYTTDTYWYFRQFGSAVEYNKNDIWSPVTFGTEKFVIDKTCHVLLTTDLVVTGNNGFFTIGADGIIFDGAGYTVTINGAGAYPGLIRNGYFNSVSKVTTKATSVTVKNLGVLAGSGTTLAKQAGWIGQVYFGAGMSGGTIVFDSCWSDGSIGVFAGGICGAIAGYQMSGASSIHITSCYSTGSIDADAGGICGFFAGAQMSGSSSIHINSCYSTGSIDESAGGICGSSAGISMSGSSITINSCYSTGTIGTDAGGILGSWIGAAIINSTILISSCYSTGSIGTGAGGICGHENGCVPDLLLEVFPMKTSKIIVDSCYSTGSIGTDAGGIYGYNTGKNTKGQISDDSSITAQNCYTYGTKKTTTDTKETTTDTKETTTNIDLIYGINKLDFTKNLTINCYSANGTWSDANAKKALTGFTTDALGVGPVWTRIGADSPWVLSDFASDIYTQNHYSGSTLPNQTYTTGPGKYSKSNGWTYQLLTGNIGISIDSTTGIITYTGTNQNITPVIAYKSEYSAYSIGYFYYNNQIKLRQFNQYVQYCLDGITWSNITWGTNGYVINVPGTVLVTTDLVLTGSNEYFTIGADGIVFDGAGHVVTVNGVTNYPGLISNGTQTNPGKSNITVKNIGVLAGTGTTLEKFGGWVGQAYFAKQADGNIITFCWSDGAIGLSAGGICGSRIGDSMLNSNLTISCCYSTGSIGLGAGGICGNKLGDSMSNSIITIEFCWSSGDINGGGGICSELFNDLYKSNKSTINISHCYSLGKIQSENNSSFETFYSGGIILGKNFLNSDTNEKSSSTVQINSCYSAGTIGNNTYGISKNNVNLVITNCYSSNGLLNWNDDDAKLNLKTGYIDSNLGVGSIWTRVGVNLQWFNVPNPWVLSAFTSDIYTPNSITNPPITNQTYTTGPGIFSNSSGWTYKLLTDNQRITIDSKTGAITYTGITSTDSFVTPVISYKVNFHGYSISYYKIN